MKLLLLSMLATAVFSPAKTTTTQPVDWVLSGPPDSECRLAADGNAMDAFGASLLLSCGADAAGHLASAASKVSAGGLRQRRITISGDIQTQNIQGASLWAKVLRDGKTLMLESTAEETLYEESAASGWVHRSIAVAVPSEATAVSFGLLLQGGGEAEVRNLRLTASGEGAASAEAQQVLDAAIEIVKAQAVRRKDIDWPALERQVRIFAAAAERSGDAYPAIKYLLAQFGDKQSLLLAPDLAGLFHVGRSEPIGQSGVALSVFALPDGAKLVLSAAAYDGRIAQAWTDSGVVAE